MTQLERILAQTVVDGDCLRWTGPHNHKGYGRISVDGRLWPVHRFVYEGQVGPVPEGLELDHLCRVRDCVNVDHLEPVTHRENLMRSENFAALYARRTHCVHGHAFDEENTRRTSGGRVCRACGRDRQRRYRAREASR